MIDFSQLSTPEEKLIVFFLYIINVPKSQKQIIETLKISERYARDKLKILTIKGIINKEQNEHGTILYSIGSECRLTGVESRSTGAESRSTGVESRSTSAQLTSLFKQTKPTNKKDFEKEIEKILGGCFPPLAESAATIPSLPVATPVATPEPKPEPTPQTAHVAPESTPEPQPAPKHNNTPNTQKYPNYPNPSNNTNK
ncbi:MAG: hypothetical protein LBE12_20630 [Planctomycetaceae bacterium]|jgi:hypothetical protein|nr:hypothetical protein [Planctomycetaceae bacterium]